MQANRLANLFQHKQAVSFAVLACQRLGAAGYADTVTVFQPQAFDQFVKGELKAIIKAPDNGCVTFVSGSGQIKMKEFTNGTPHAAEPL
jgi:hypothetical protein